MTRERVPETDIGIQGGVTVEIYDQMQRRLRDKGWIETNQIIKSGISSGLGLEIGPGPGYLGLEWLKNTTGTCLKGLEISDDMIEVAERNAKTYELSTRVTYVKGTGALLPFEEGTFDGVFTASSLHEWSDPRSTFLEIWRVLKPGGRLMISDFRRDMSPIAKGFLWLAAKPKEMRSGLLTSINAAYTPGEIRSMLPERMETSCEVVAGLMGLNIIGMKQN